ncbi:MAG: N-acetylmuramoyl-L-alanine amidase [Anaerolineae bacterium]|nr:N-acetylmuramoyl-L-alanine amidase [Anaerolineae bacterium]
MRNFGLWVSNGPPQDIDTMLGLAKDGAYTVLHEGAGAEQARKIIAKHAGAQILVRHHRPDWPTTDPVAWAQEVAGRMVRDYTGITLRVVGANEPNLEPAPDFSEANYRALGRWYRAFAAEVKRLNPVLLVHFPAWAAGHSEDQNDLGFIGYLLPEVVEAIRICDAANCHCYWEPNEGPLREMGGFGGGLRYRHVARLLRANGILYQGGDYPIWIDEAGPWAQPARVEQTAAHSDAARSDRLAGCTYFLWADPTNNPGNTINQWLGRIPDDKRNWLIGEWDRLAALPLPPVPVVSVPVSMSTTTTVPQGGTLPVSPAGILDVVDRLPQHPTLRYDTRPLSAITRVVIHHSAAPGDRSPEAIARYHIQADPARQKEAWAGIGYHYYLTADGKTYQTQRLTTVSAHVLGKNESAVGICFAGDFTETTPTPPQVAAGRALLKQLLGDLNLKIDAVSPHKDVNPGRTECPGSDWWKTLLPEGAIVPVSQPPVSTSTPPARPQDEAIREAAWNRLYPQGVPFNPASAFFKAARARQLGVPVTGEFDLSSEFRAQGYLGGILVARVGDWDNMTLVDWLGQEAEGLVRDVFGQPEAAASPPKRRRRVRRFLP